MTDILDKVLETAKKLRKYAKKSADPAFVNLITDLNMELADLRVQLAQGRSAPADDEQDAPPAPRAAAPAASSRAEQVAAAPTTRGLSPFDATLNTVFGDDKNKPQ
jgi:hypothetical protein